jgi:hypothetical protein
MPYPYGPLFRLLALTGQRKSEVAEARWSEFDIPGRLWHIPPGRMKGDAAHVVPLTPEAVARNCVGEQPMTRPGNKLADLPRPVVVTTLTGAPVARRS